MWITAESVLFIATCVLGAVALEALFRRRVSAATRRELQSTATDLYMSAASEIYAVILAFVLSGALGSFQRTRDNALEEINAIAHLVELAQGLPPPVRDPVLAGARDYFASLLHQDWPLTAQGASSPEADALLARLRAELSTFRPADAEGVSLRAAALEQVNGMAGQRRMRIMDAHRGASRFVWAILVIGGVIVLGFGMISGLERTGMKLGMTAALTGLIALSLFTIRVLSAPFPLQLMFSQEDYRLLTQLVQAHP